VAGPYEQGNDPSSCVRCGEFPEQLGDKQLLIKDQVKYATFASFLIPSNSLYITLSYDTT
jgi:hypothetical protein